MATISVIFQRFWRFLGVLVGVVALVAFFGYIALFFGRVPREYPLFDGNSSPVISGETIAFACDDEDNYDQICVVQSDGSGLRRLTNNRLDYVSFRSI